MKKSSLYISFVLVLVAGLFFGFLIGQSYTLNKGETIDKVSNETASLMIDFADGRIDTYNEIPVAQADTVFEMTKRTAEENNIEFVFDDYGDLGKLVSKIADREGGQENKYWQYWVNNISPSIGADAYAVGSGDVIEWKFIQYIGDE